MTCNKRCNLKWAHGVCLLLLAVSAICVSALPAQATLAFGDFEGAATGWGDSKSGGFNPLTTLPFTSPDGVTHYELSSSHPTSGTQSLKVDSTTGLDFNLSYNPGAAGAPVDINDFLANDTITFDVTFAGGVPGGFNRIDQLAIKTDSGFHSLTTKFSTPDVETDQTVAVSYDYSGVPFAVTTTFIEMRIATNSDGDPSHRTYYFDNFQLSLSAVPEPSSFVMLALVSSLGGIFGARRQRCRNR